MMLRNHGERIVNSTVVAWLDAIGEVRNVGAFSTEFGNF